MTLKDDLLPVVDELRAMPGELGFRPYTEVAVLVRKWSGGRPGVGTLTTTTATITVFGQPPKVREVTSQEVIASGGAYHDEDLKIGPLTPEYSVGGVSFGTSIAAIDPTLDKGSEILWRVKGPGNASVGDFYHKINQHTDRAMRYFVFVRRTGTV